MTVVLTPETKLEDFIAQVVAEVKSRDLDVSTTGFGPWSPSKVKALLACPLSFLMNNMLRVGYQIPIDPSLAENESMYFGGIGSAAHTTLEHMVLGKSFEDAAALAKEKHLEEVTHHHWHHVEVLEDNIKNFFVRLDKFAAANPVKEFRPELRYAVDKDWNAIEEGQRNAYFRGVIDLSIFLENDDAVLLDHKRGGSAKYGMNIHKFQLTAYSVLLLAHNPQLKGITPMIHFIAEGDIAVGEYASREKVLSQYTQSVESTIHGAVDILLDAKEFKYKTGSACNYCDFKPLCRGGKRGTANHLQPIIEASRVLFKC